MNYIDTLKERGFIDNMTDEEGTREYLESGPKTCYIGFDPTAASFHVGNLTQIMALAHFQRHGHKPIALMGGGTGLVGDPSGKDETRKLLSIEKIESNAVSLKGQMGVFIDFNNDNAYLLNNAKWLTEIKYINFLRDIGKHFSINKMIKNDTYKKRLESDVNLSFIEFNYMLLQSFDFLTLSDIHDCRLQMGGSDQWGNIVSGIELIRRINGKKAFGITSPLITTSSGLKMGKTAKGAIWLDSSMTSPYDYYQYWINTDDRDVVRFLSLFTFLPIEQIRTVEKLKDRDLNTAKIILAFETTKIAHGYDEAVKAYKSSLEMFGSRKITENILEASDIPRNIESDIEASKSSSVPSTYISPEQLKDGLPAFAIFHISGLANSKGAARRLIEQGGAYINDKRAESVDSLIHEEDFKDGELLLRAGKKRYHKIIIGTKD